MTPLQAELHSARQARLARMGAPRPNYVPIERVRPAIAPPPQTAPIPIAPIPAKPKHGFWFRILSDDKPKPFCLEAIQWPIRIEHVQRFVSDYFELSVAELVSVRRSEYAVIPRQVAMYLCKQVLLNKSLPEIGRRFNRDHTTVLHAVRKIEGRLQEGDLLACAIRHLEGRLRAAMADRLKPRANEEAA